jgi:muconolactone delta-isomerase
MAYSTRIKPDFLRTDDIVVHLHKGGKGEMMFSVTCRTEHGWTKEKLMTVANWQRHALLADVILGACDMVADEAESIRVREARKAEYYAALGKLDGVRSLLPETAIDSALARIFAQFPEFAPADAVEPVEAEEVD